VEEAAAFTVPDGEGSLAIRSAVVVDGDADVGEREIVAAVRKVLPLHAVPDGVAVMDSLPRTPTGKVDRKTLKGLLTAAGETHDD
jgi:acyl-coenzyme A synthetase/AMP-(fatty) acid ligase